MALTSPRRLLAVVIAISGLCISASVVSGREPGTAGAAAHDGAQISTFLANVNLDFTIPRIAPGASALRIDGNLDEPAWKQSVELSNFAEVSPGENVLPKVNTKAYMCYDDEYLYVGFRCYEDDPTAIRASITDRDNIFRDDFIGIMIDTFKDQQNGYEFFVNPHGIQGDLRRTGNNEDPSYDTVWKSGGRINDSGWTAEMAIPFRSIRFPDDADQTWGIHVFRIRPRDSREQLSWAPISRDQSCFFCAAGNMGGLIGINHGRNIELLPYVIASQTGSLAGNDDASFGWNNDHARSKAGVGVKYGLTSNLTLDFTYNPDFSQIESDAAQIDVNNTFALFYPEKRPFFLEGADIFNTSIDAVYTRSINDPVAAAKLTGKMGKTTVGFMSAKDDVSPYTVPFEERSAITTGGESYSNVVRVKRDVLGNSYVGALATDRRPGNGADGNNSTFGIDTRLRFKESYTVAAQIQGSHTEEPTDSTLSQDFADIRFGRDGRYTSFFDGERFDGYAAEGSFERSGRHYNFFGWYENYSPTFRAENGFIRANDYQMAGFWNGYMFQLDKHRFLERLEPQFEWGRKVNSVGVFKDTWYSPGLWVRFKKQVSAWTGYVWSDERFADERVNGIRRWSGNLTTDSSSLLSGGFAWNLGRSLVRDRDNPRLGNQRTLDVWTTLKPTSQLRMETNYTLFELNELGGTKDEIFNTFIVRNHLSYQFTRNLFLRVVTQYVDSDKYWQVDPLLSYKINPFTVFFAGSSHSFNELRDDPDTTPVEVQNPHYEQTSRVFFVKFQYLFRV